MAILIHPTRATRDIYHIGVRKGDRMYHVLSDIIGPAGGRELRMFVRGCGLRPGWAQYPGTYREHFDAHAHVAECLLRRGARLVGNHEVGRLLRAKRAAQTGAAAGSAGAQDSAGKADGPEGGAAEDDDAGDGTAADGMDVIWGPVAGVPGEAELGVLGDVAGRDVLEVGCGGGRNVLSLARQGARCVGLDPSPDRLERARRLMTAAGVSVPLVLGEPLDLVRLADASFDVVFSAFETAGYVADLPRCLREMARVLRPGGICALSWFSPFFDVFPTSGADQLTPVRSYFDQEPVTEAGAVPGGRPAPRGRYHHTISAWVAAFVGAGLILTDVLELEPHPRLWRPSARPDVPWEKVAMVPSTTIWRGRKPRVPPSELQGTHDGATA
jgi:SAM-dependent methyltransferase